MLWERFNCRIWTHVFYRTNMFLIEKKDMAERITEQRNKDILPLCTRSKPSNINVMDNFALFFLTVFIFKQNIVEGVDNIKTKFPNTLGKLIKEKMQSNNELKDFKNVIFFYSYVFFYFLYFFRNLFLYRYRLVIWVKCFGDELNNSKQINKTTRNVCIKSIY